MGEKFQIDLRKGTENYSIPIEMPTGRNGISPELALSYSASHRNGVLGLGCDLSIPNISRKTDKGAPQYKVCLKNEDTFILAGAEDLVLISLVRNTNPLETENHRQYNPRTKGLFARIKNITRENKRHREVATKSGIKNTCGLVSAENPCQVYSINRVTQYFPQFDKVHIATGEPNLSFWYICHVSTTSLAQVDQSAEIPGSGLWKR